MEASEIARLACEAGMVTEHIKAGAASCVHTLGCGGVSRAELERFADLVEAAAMEKAAKIAEAEHSDFEIEQTPYNAAVCDVAAAIRAAAKTPERCPLCRYQHGHAIGCANNPVDIGLRAAAKKEA